MTFLESLTGRLACRVFLFRGASYRRTPVVYEWVLRNHVYLRFMPQCIRMNGSSRQAATAVVSPYGPGRIAERNEIWNTGNYGVLLGRRTCIAMVLRI